MFRNNMIQMFINYFNMYESALEDENIDENDLLDKLRQIVANVFPQRVLNLLPADHIVFNNEQVQMRVLHFTNSVYKNFIGFGSIGHFNNDSKYSISIIF